MNTLQINTRVRRLVNYIQDIEGGLVQIPAFQRDFIWTNKNKLELFDSLKRGYPIGSILFWQPKENYGENEKIGPYTVPSKRKNKDFFYILDGFQRLSTVFGCLINPYKTKLECDKQVWKKEFQICYDLAKEEFFIPRGSSLEPFQAPLYEIIDSRVSYYFEKKLRANEGRFSEEEIALFMERNAELGSRLTDYLLPSIDIIGGEIEEAVDIFSRVNSMGTQISNDWRVSALAYKDGFRLGSLIDNLFEDLEMYNFKEIKRELILQCIINSFGKVFFDQSKKLGELAKRDDFEDVSLKTIQSIKKAIKFLFDELLVIDSKLLPYNNQLIFITDFFNQIEAPSIAQLQELKKWFWITTYSNYFTIYSLSKQREAYSYFQKFIKGEVESPVYNDKPDLPFLVADFPTKIYFKSVRATALVLFLLNQNKHHDSLKPEKIEGLKLYYLFSDTKDDNGNFPPESSVPMINILSEDSEKMKDASSYFTNYKPEYEKLFLTKKMKELFENGKKKEILSLRKSLIIDAERNFVNSLGLKYEI